MSASSPHISPDFGMLHRLLESYAKTGGPGDPWYEGALALERIEEQLESQGRHLAVALDQKLVTEVAFSELREQVDAFRTEAEEQQGRWLVERDKRMELQEQLEALESDAEEFCRVLQLTAPKSCQSWIRKMTKARLAKLSNPASRPS